MSGSLLFRVAVPFGSSSAKVLNDIIRELNVKNPVWMDGSDEETNEMFKLVYFYLENGRETEEAIKTLTGNGIGVAPKTSIGLFQCYLNYQGSKESSPRIKVTSPVDDNYSWEKFIESVKPRLAVSQIVESVKRKASLTFDFVVLLIVAALLASLGLVVDNNMILLTSFWISPMMHPMIAATFGTVVGQWKLRKLGITNGLLGLLVCLSIGFLFGITASCFQGYESMNGWPTSLMYEMGTTQSLWTGAILAIFSGVAVSIGILGDDTGTIQGVASSAALLPPAVNAGLLWSRSVLLLTFPSLPNNSRQIYSENAPLELAYLGTVSMALSFLNVLFIFISGNILLKIKEVASAKEIHRDVRWEKLKEFKPFTSEEVQQITMRLGINPVRDIGIHHWTVSPNLLFDSHKMERGLETWSGSGCMERRPRLQDLASRMALGDHESRGENETNENLLTPTLVDDRGSSSSYITPPGSRFTVVPVQALLPGSSTAIKIPRFKSPNI